MANSKFDSKSFNAEAFKYMVDRVPNLNLNELKKSRALAGNPDIRGVFTAQNGTAYARLAMRGLIDGDAVNYDGQTDITATSTKTFEQGKATCAYCTAKYSGVAGNKLYVVIAANADNSSLFDVSLYYDTTLLDTQTVAAATALKDNDFVTWKTTASLAATAKTPLTGGTNGTANAAAHQAALDKFESYSFNTLGCPSDDSTTIKLYINYTKRLRDEVGAKFQTVIFNLDSNEKLADYEGVIEIGSKVTDYDSGISGLGQYGLVYWMTGASAGCAVNKSNTNKKYDGELTVDVDRTQAELEAAIKAGRLMFHNVNGDVRILEDIDSLITVSDTKGDVFKSNQTIRVCDQIANDTAVLFNTRYLGTVPNDAAGRIALWNDICKLHQDLESIRAIEDFDPDSVTVEQGDTKKAVLCTVKDLNVVNAMAQLYMSVIIM